MAEATMKTSFADRIGWETRVRPLLVKLLVLAVGFLGGLYVAAPVLAAKKPTHLPATFTAMPLGAVQVLDEDGSGGLLPVRLADSSTHRGVGFRNVGEHVLDNQFLLYVLTRQTTSRASYAVDGVRAPLEYAAIDEQGLVVAKHEAPLGATRLSVPEPHRWLLAARSGTLERFGVDVGSTIDPESIRKF